MIDIQSYIHSEVPANASVEDVYAAILEIEDQLEEIKDAVRERLIQKFEEDPDSIDSFIISHTAPRRIVGWKSIAEELNPPEELIERYTRLGDPGYRIKRKDEK